MTRNFTNAGAAQFYDLLMMVEDIAQMKPLYRKEALQYHPDMGEHADEDKFKALAEAYEFATEDYARTRKNRWGDNHNVEKEVKLAKDFADKIAEVFKAAPHAEVEVIGCWIWVCGIKYEDKDTRDKIKALLFRWHGKKKCWYWDAGNPTWEKKRRRQTKSMDQDEIRAKYGSTTVKNDKEDAKAKPRRGTALGSKTNLLK